MKWIATKKEQMKCADQKNEQKYLIKWYGNNILLLVFCA